MLQLMRRVAAAAAVPVAVLVFSIPSAPTSAQLANASSGAGELDWSQAADLAGPAGPFSEGFGDSVAVSGQTAVVGGDLEGSDHAGRAYVFQEGAVGWHQVARLAGSGTANGAGFGYSVSVSGQTAIVGAHGGGPGRAYVFQDSAQGWHQVAELPGPAGGDQGYFGYSVAVSGGTAVVGDAGQANGAGRVYVFQEGAGGWHKVAVLACSGTEKRDGFGWSVAVSGRTAIIGADGNPGRAYVFQAGAGGWHQVAVLVGSGTSAEDAFGYSVAVSGGTAVVGDFAQAEGAGRAYVFHDDANGWHRVAEFAGAGDEDYFGYSVAVSGGTAVVGAYAQADYAGRAYVFQEGTAGSWRRVGALAGRGTTAGDGFGYSVAVSGGTAVVGDDSNLNDFSRPAYVFRG